MWELNDKCHASTNWSKFTLVGTNSIYLSFGLHTGTVIKLNCIVKATLMVIIPAYTYQVIILSIHVFSNNTCNITCFILTCNKQDPHPCINTKLHMDCSKLFEILQFFSLNTSINQVISFYSLINLKILKYKYFGGNLNSNWVHSRQISCNPPPKKKIFVQIRWSSIKQFILNCIKPTKSSQFQPIQFCDMFMMLIIKKVNMEPFLL